MSKISKFSEKYWPYLTGTMILLSIVLYYVIFNQSLQLFHYDMMEQVLRSLMRGYDLIRSPGIEFWDWTHFFGASVFTHFFYFLFSPFWLIYALLPSKESLPYGFLFVNILKHILLYVNSVIYLSNLRKSKVSIFAGASIITFSGFALGYYNYSIFTDVMLFVPLVLYFVDIYLKKGNIIGLVVTVSIMASINAYLMVLFTSYIFIYTLFRYCVIHENIELSKIITDGLKFVLLYLLGLGIGAFALIPSFEILLSTSRISFGGNLYDTISKFDLFRYVTGFIQPIVDRNNFNPLINKNIVPSFGHSGGAAVYSLIISPLLVPQLISMKIKAQEKIGMLVLYAFMIILAFFPNLYFLMQGNNDTRWMVMFIFLNAYVVSYVLDRITEIRKATLFFTTIVLGLSLLVSYYISTHYGLQNEAIYSSIAKRNVIILGITVVIYFVTLFYINNLKIQKIILILMLVGESYFALYNIFFNPVTSIAMPAGELESYHIADDSLSKAIQAQDNDVYRIDALENYAFNDPMGKDYMGFTFYSSVYNYEIDPFIHGNVASAGGWVVGSNPGKWQYKTMFGAKYWYDLTGQYQAPFGYEYDLSVPYGNQIVDIYRYSYPVPFIYTMDQELSFEYWKTLSTLDKMRTLMSNVVTESSNDQSPAYPNELIHLGDFGTSLDYRFDSVQTDALFYVSFPRSEEVKMTFMLNGETVKTYYSYEPNYSSVYVTENFDQILFEVTNLYGVPESEFINSAFIEYPFDVYDEWYVDLMENASSDVQLGTNTFNGTINSKRDAWVVTSIAYDKNWNVIVNGTAVETSKVNGGFIGFKVKAGENRIEAVYKPKSFYIGLGVSFISIIILALLEFRRKIGSKR